MKYDDKSPITRESDKFMLRLPDGMRERIAATAKINGRSMNAEIIARLESSFADEGSLSEIDRKFLLGLVGAMKQASTESHVADVALRYPDGSLAVLEFKKQPSALKFADMADEAPPVPPRRRIRIRKDPKP